uniref:Uncharacterized protein n=1 Tax=Setaria viridis TaxID=4556 RepID=A0A4U6SYI0_SETVI|nr:hypothetical protein SEVIR_9G235700v2 [Setaria viridis]
MAARGNGVKTTFRPNRDMRDHIELTGRSNDDLKKLSEIGGHLVCVFISMPLYTSNVTEGAVDERLDAVDI